MSSRDAISRCLASIGRDMPSIVVAAHRGASTDAPENTLAAFDLAISYGVDAVEFDVRVTSDDELVVIHDARLGRTVQGSSLIASMGLAEVVALDAGAWFGGYEGELVPSLSDALDMLHERVVPIIDLKDGGENGARAAKILARALIDRDIEESCVVVSTHPENLRVVSDMCPETPVGLVTTMFSDATEAVRAPGYDGCLVWWHSLTREMSDVALSRGDFVAAWTVPASKLARVIDAGANVIVTNQPREVLDQLGDEP